MLMLQYMGPRVCGMGGNGTRWDSSLAGHRLGRSRSCASICLRSWKRISSQRFLRRMSLVGVHTPCFRSSRMRCFDCMMTRSGHSETISVSGKLGGHKRPITSFCTRLRDKGYMSARLLSWLYGLSMPCSTIT
ncbi:uncharacterized protein CC84DRAFT_487582 [Paraphaeosphaeria sporulosa]|uniref:Uncharacterized protein n=1 Tax=Paraphaeosphaeria sporulosa TaxID=1460663 RepID=A0A177CTN6_9PLEO|nr:uncharacterized protein CC84DRAFT_487582 [Paraphaeosphaeria sporulosa]OAG10551.1 hypothetical protein CC84DRAFT_487582 [Paraphaeosphaeria sporulosa]